METEERKSFRKDESAKARYPKLKFEVETAAQAFLELLSLRGIDYFFGNAGTDFASLVDAFARRQSEGKNTPKPLTIPHEIPLVSMAHGYYLATGRPQAAMVHVGIGTANGLGALIQAHRARIPMLLCAGRTSITEEGHPASRDVFIHWGQECFDQAGMLREYVKWDYELRTVTNMEAVVDRALAMAMTEPRGPVYLMLPREVLATPMSEVAFHAQPRNDLPTFYPEPTKIRRAAELLKDAEFPLIITSAVGRSPSAVSALIELAEATGAGVVSFNPEYMNFPTEHPYHLGFLPQPLLSKADLVLVVDCDVPWYPSKTRPNRSATIIQVGVDPLYSAYPVRSFPSDLTIQAEPEIALSELTRVLKEIKGNADEARTQARRKDIERMHAELLKGWQEKEAKAAGTKPLDLRWVSRNMKKVLPEETIVVNERDNGMHPYTSQRPGSYFCTPHAGYLGWGFGAALGVKLAAPDRTVVAAVGDGCYMFGVPSACHFVAHANRLPVLVVVYNNQCYQAVKGATRAVYPDGWAVKTNQFPLSELQPVVHFEKICEAFGGYGERVEDPEQIGPALERGLKAVQEEGRQALLNVICQHP
jgi:acetolactate synthase-1/2/3 large subunit